MCLRNQRFRGYQQQDSHELLRYLLDNMKTEEIKVSTHKLTFWSQFDLISLEKILQFPPEINAKSICYSVEIRFLPQKRIYVLFD